MYLSRTQETASSVFLVRVSEQHLLGIYTSHPTFTTAKSSCSFSHLAVERFEQQSVFLVLSHFSVVRVGLHVPSDFISMERTLLE